MASNWMVGVVTMEATPWAQEENFGRMEEYIREAARRRAQLVVAPESVLDGYVCGADPDVTRERMLEIAQTIPDGPYLARGAELSRELGIYLVFGFLELDGDDLFNSCVLFNPQGDIIAKHSKVHCGGEAFITPGRELRPFDTPMGRIGFLICKDRGVPDNFNMLGVQDVDAVIIPMDGSGGKENTRKLIQRAQDNCCWIVVANTWSAVIIDPNGEVMLEKYESECVSVQRADFKNVPKGDGRRRFSARRYDLYSTLAKSFEADKYYDADGRATDFAEESGQEHRKGLRERAER